MRVRLGLPAEMVPIFWGMFFLEATFGAYLGVWPLWIERLGAPVAVVGLVLGASGFLRLAVLAPSAAIADRLGYRRALLLSRSAAGIGLLSAAVATHWTQLAVMLVGAAIGELAFPLVQSLLAAQAGEERLRAFALVFTVGPSIALIVSPLIAGGLVAIFGIRAAFLFGALCTAISLWFLARVHESPELRTHHDRPPSSYRAALGNPAVRLVAPLLGATVFALSLGTALVPTFLEDVRGMDAATIATLGAASAVGSASFGLALARVRRFQRVPFVAVAGAVAVTAIGFLLFRSTAALLLIVVAFYCRGGLFSSWATLTAALGELAPAAHRARAFALCEMIGGLGYALGPIAAAQLYGVRASLPFDVAIALAVLLVPILILAQRRANRLPREPSAVLTVPVSEQLAG